MWSASFRRDYALLSAQIGYQFDERVSLRLTAENLTDKKYYTRIDVGRGRAISAICAMSC